MSHNRLGRLEEQASQFRLGWRSRKLILTHNKLNLMSVKFFDTINCYVNWTEDYCKVLGLGRLERQHIRVRVELNSIIDPCVRCHISARLIVIANEKSDFGKIQFVRGTISQSPWGMYWHKIRNAPWWLIKHSVDLIHFLLYNNKKKTHPELISSELSWNKTSGEETPIVKGPIDSMHGSQTKETLKQSEIREIPVVKLFSWKDS